MVKHLTYDNRLTIEEQLKFKTSLSKIARKLNRHKSTISREIFLRSIINKNGCYGRSYNACIYRFDCDMKNICREKKCNKRKSFCRFCKECNDNCGYFKEDVCDYYPLLLMYVIVAMTGINAHLQKGFIQLKWLKKITKKYWLIQELAFRIHLKKLR